MSEKSFVHLLGIIKWINLMTVFVLLSNFLSSLNIPSQIAIIIQLVLVGIASYLVDKWIETKYSSENLIENTLLFRIINVFLILTMAIFLIDKEQWIVISLIVVYILYVKSDFILNKMSNRRKGEKRSSFYA